MNKKFVIVVAILVVIIGVIFAVWYYFLANFMSTDDSLTNYSAQTVSEDYNTKTAKIVYRDDVYSVTRLAIDAFVDNDNAWCNNITPGDITYPFYNKDVTYQKKQCSSTRDSFVLLSAFVKNKDVTSCKNYKFAEESEISRQDQDRICDYITWPRISFGIDIDGKYPENKDVVLSNYINALIDEVKRKQLLENNKDINGYCGINSGQVNSILCLPYAESATRLNEYYNLRKDNKPISPRVTTWILDMSDVNYKKTQKKFYNKEECMSAGYQTEGVVTFGCSINFE